jgi:pimeloyl-ACP methyl ester carboxylesterase
MATAPNDNFLTVNGLRLHYLDWGGESRRAILLVHGFGGNANNWIPFAERMRGDYRVVALDQRGHGDSDHAREGYPVTAFAADLHELARALGIAPVVCIGNSLGARNSIAFAGQYPGDVSRLILLDGGPELPEKVTSAFIARLPQRPRSFPGEQSAMDYLKKGNPGHDDSFYRQVAANILRKNWVGQYIWKNDPETSWIYESAVHAEAPYVWELFRRISCPTLVVQCEHSPDLPAETAQRMAAANPKAALVQVKGASHGFHQNRPADFERIVREFLGKG